METTPMLASVSKLEPIVGTFTVGAAVGGVLLVGIAVVGLCAAFRPRKLRLQVYLGASAVALVLCGILAQTMSTNASRASSKVAAKTDEELAAVRWCCGCCGCRGCRVVPSLILSWFASSWTTTAHVLN